MVGRIPVIDVAPVVDGGRRPAKATVGEPFPVSALVFREGHGAVAADVVLTGPDGVRRAGQRMVAHPTEPDSFSALVTPDRTGAWSFEIEAWGDPVATWRRRAEATLAAGADVEPTLADGALVLERAAQTLPRRSGPARVLGGAVSALRDGSRSPQSRYQVATAGDVDAVLAVHPLRELVTTEGPYPFHVDRERALVGAWYELFPRSEGARLDKTGVVVPGTLRTAARRLEGVAAMGFDVVYLPPVHPIGRTHRRGRNNTSVARPDDVGSPWAVGGPEGGHDAVHPDLGTLADFDAFVARAAELGLEVALDLALQCSPDHPWVREHPEWFATRADGTIAHAENPPKTYPDIYPLCFDTDPKGLYAEVLRIVRFWIGHGVRVFRVDNPHTKPVDFWEWLLGEVRDSDPDVVFLAEAFTRPAMMRTLGAVGFHQSYTYITWRNEKAELEQYLTELAHQTSAVLRPNLFLNTPDILTSYLQYGGPAAFKIRAVVGATGGPSWGIYAGFELCEHVAVRPGSEEYLDAEKYEIKVRDWARAARTGRTLAPYLTRLNEVRRAHPALRQLHDLTVHRTDDDHVLCFSKRAGDDRVIVVVNLDPHGTRETTVHLRMPELGMHWAEQFGAYDAMTGQAFTWGEHNFVRLDPYVEPAHVLSVGPVPPPPPPPPVRVRTDPLVGKNATEEMPA